jgi:Protein of unknown function (DUF1592)/Protein of unknown function (DUF1588)/Protein of unknown function (DUF1585)/Protein of unknown function (DUF1587)/Protein of unknown function (DUF1595)/Planctomycete cytochrome C
MRFRPALCVTAMLATLLAAAATVRAEEPTTTSSAKSGSKLTFAKDVLPLLNQYCTKCHGGPRPKAGFALDRFKDEASALKERKVWEKVAQNLHAGDMPPPGRKRPTSAEMAVLTTWADAQLASVDCMQERDPGRVTIRRLNRVEYNNTIRDLVGIQFQPANDFPADDVGYGFDNIGDVLSLSPLLLEKYLAAAEKVADLAFQNPQARKRILFRELKGKNKTAAVRAIVENFARRAYRRPVKDEEVARLVKFVDLVEKNGDGTVKGIQLAVQAVLVSPHFLFRVEQDRRLRKGMASVYPINQCELASRLSYFLWSSMPDEELFRLAGSFQLRAKLEAQVKRMLADPKAEALTKNFAGQWLQIRNLQSMTPDPGTFPGFDEELRAAMLKETELFFDAIVKEDRSILDFIDSDFTFVNERLARHYGIPGVKGNSFRRVQLTGERGGLLTQASILTVTSNPTRTSPVKRGKWILDNILNTPPPPPPPDVPELEEQKGEIKGSLRQRMEQHRAKAICASCHQRMDPLGFGFENFDGIGAWRTREGKFAIEPSGTLPSGQTFKGPKELRVVLKQKEEEFRRCLAEKMLTYALGRGLEYYDKCAVNDIAEAVKRNDYRFSSLVLAIVKSDPFQKRKALGGAK